jgi:acyl-CoA thioester hydrolase
MPRIKLNECDKYRFIYEHRIQLSQINIAGHTGSVELTSLIQEARYRMLKKMDLSDLNLGDGETGGIMSDIVINFKGEIFLDDLISIEMEIPEIDEKGYRVYCRVVKNDSTVALAETGFVTFSFKERKKKEVPQAFIDKLQGITDQLQC